MYCQREGSEVEVCGVKLNVCDVLTFNGKEQGCLTLGVARGGSLAGGKDRREWLWEPLRWESTYLEVQ